MTRPKTNSDANGKTPKRKPRKPKVTKPDPLTIQGTELLWVPGSMTSPINDEHGRSAPVSVHGANEQRERSQQPPSSEPSSQTPPDIGSADPVSIDSQDAKTDAVNSDGKPSSTPPTATQPDEQDTGNDTLGSAVPGGDMPAEWLELLNLARARDGETHKQCWERLRREARTAGMTRRDAISYAGRAVDHVWIAPVIPEPAPEPETFVIPESEPVPDPEMSTIVDNSPPSDDGVAGLGDLPADWPQLPANASLQAEISWVTANRLRVRDGTGVDLSRALSPAPSYSALSWLETSILFPSKFADISVKATANQDDEKELIRREKASIEEIRSILAEMLDG